jgi:hypothetical protein
VEYVRYTICPKVVNTADQKRAVWDGKLRKTDSDKKSDLVVSRRVVRFVSKLKQEAVGSRWPSCELPVAAAPSRKDLHPQSKKSTKSNQFY